MSGESDNEPRQGRQQNGEPPQNQSQQGRPSQGQQQQGVQQPQGQPRQQPPGRQPRGGGNEAEIGAAKLGTLVFALVGLGYFMMTALVAFIGDENAGLFSGQGSDQLYIAATASINALEVFIPVLAVGVAAYYYRTDTLESVPKLSVIAATAGAFVVSLVLLLLVMVFTPDGVSVDFGQELPGFIGVVLGTVVIAGVAGYVLDEDPAGVF